MISTMCILNHIALSVVVLSVLWQQNVVVHAKGVTGIMYSGIHPKQLDLPWLVKHAVGFPHQAPIGSNQLWHINDSPYYQ